VSNRCSLLSRLNCSVDARTSRPSGLLTDGWRWSTDYNYDPLQWQTSRSATSSVRMDNIVPPLPGDDLLHRGLHAELDRIGCLSRIFAPHMSKISASNSYRRPPSELILRSTDVHAGICIPNFRLMQCFFDEIINVRSCTFIAVNLVELHCLTFTVLSAFCNVVAYKGLKTSWVIAIGLELFSLCVCDAQRRHTSLG